ncbi:MAG: hypothetical protein CYG60_14230 [Actinobacteria bacterium]|nr:hypothetical protein [Actinomycetota bacterium]PLS85102.1 MAG: hypothetical protein CYG60_14230 [Actinomycetota bacterium]
MSENVPAFPVSLPLDAAETLHNALEDLLESGHGDPTLERSYRILSWRILAARGEGGNRSDLIARMAQAAREAETLEEYEAVRNDALGPILDGLESAENRDP